MSSTQTVEGSPAEHSVSSAESNLADDAPWKKIQKNTFTRWCNEHLRCVDREIEDLQFDLNDGLTLIALLEVLSHKKMFRRYHTRPTFRQMRLDNVSVALEFLEQENIKLVSIDSKAIVDGNMKLILGLVWTLILHYSISSPLLEDGGQDKARKQTPELRLLGWIQDKVPELPITNFSQDWMNGKALGALVDGLAPGLCPDWESWDEVQRVDNAREAMQQADKWLGVPQVIAPEEIIDPRVDEQSIMTYLSMFPKAQLKPGAPLKPKSVSKPKACRASGRGLQPRGLRVGQTADFKVDTSRAGPGDLEVHVTGPDDSEVPVQLKDATDDMYTLQYHPTAHGHHTIDITWAGEHILKSPFKVGVWPRAGPQAVRAWGPGLQGGVVGMSADFVVESICAEAGMLEPGEYAVHVTCDEEEIQDSPFMSHISPSRKKSYPHKVKVFGPGVSQTGFVLKYAIEFTVDTRFAGDGSLGLYAQNFDGEPVSVEVVHKENGVYTCSYTAVSEGKHTISVSWGGVSVPGSPFRVMPARVRIEPSFNTSTKRSKRSGILGDGNDKNLAESIDSINKLDLNVTSPTKLPSDASKVKAYGPGLEGGVIGSLAELTIDTTSCGSGQLCVTVDGPCPTKMKCLDNKDGTCTVTYLPTERGKHLINILFQGIHIPGSPFQADVHMPFDHSKVVVSGPGLTKAKVGEPCVVNIDCALAGVGELSAEAVSESGHRAKTKVRENLDGTYTVVYVPLTAGVYTLRLKYGGKVLDNFPSEVVVDPAVYTSQVKVCGRKAEGEDQNDLEEESKPAKFFASGMGLVQGVTGQNNSFSVRSRRNGAGGLDISVEGPSDSMVSCTEKQDGHYDIQYVPSMPGVYDINITSGGKHILGSPFRVPVKDASDIKDVKVSGSGVEMEMCLLSPQTFTIDCSKSGEAPESVAVMTPSGQMELVEVTNNGDGTCSVAYSPSMEGAHCLLVKYADEDECHFPVPFQVLPTNDSKKLKVSGPGLESGLCAKVPQTFTIDSSSSGEPPESVAVMTPSGKMEHVEVTDNGDGTYSVAYSPSMEGDHSLLVKYADEDDFCSLSDFQVLPTNDSKKLKVSGPGLESGLCVKVPQTFTIDSSSSGEPPESVAVMTPSGKMEHVEVTDNGDGTYSVAYSPSMEGDHSLLVKYADEEEFCSPFQFQVLPSDPNRKLSVSVPGLDSGVCAQIPQTFTIDSKNGEVPESMAVRTPSGELERVEVTDNGDGTYSVAYSPAIEGAHSVMVKYADEDDFCNVSDFQVLPTNDSKKLNVSGPGLESGLCAKVPQTFTIDSSSSGEPPESVAVMTPSGRLELVEVTDNGDGTYSVAYSPSMEGDHSLLVKYADEDEFCSPFQFQVLPKVPSRKLSILLPGLDSGVCAQIPQTFTIDSKNGEVPESVALRTPSEKMELVEVTDNGDGTYSVAYSPSMEGDHSLLVKYADEDDFCSLSDLQVLPTNDSKKLKVSGPGLESGLCAKVPQTFTIDSSSSGEPPESVAVMTPSGKMELVKVTDNGDGTYSVAYSPSMEGGHSLLVKYSDEDEFCSPFQFQVLPSDPNRKLSVSVPGLESGVCAQIPQTFTIDSKNGEVPESVAVRTPSGEMERVEVTDNGDGTYSVAYSPSMEGDHSLLVKYSDEDEFCSPYNFHVKPATDAISSKHSGDTESESRVSAKVPQNFTIGCSKTGGAPESVAMMMPNGKIEHVEVTDNGDGTYSVAYSPSMEGAHSLLVKYADEEEFCSPFQCHLLSCHDASKVQASGPGLKSGLPASLPAKFVVDTTEAGKAELTVRIIDPDGRERRNIISISRDGTYEVSYIPDKAGGYQVVIRYGGDEIPSSPFHVWVIATGDADKCIVTGPGLGTVISAGEEISFVVNTQSAGMGKVSCFVLTPDGTEVEADVIEKQDGTFEICYSASQPGNYILSTGFGGECLFTRPFEVMAPDNELNPGQVTKDSLQLTMMHGSYIPLRRGNLTGLMPFDIVMAFGFPESEITGEVCMPSGSRAQAEVVDNGDGTVSLMYDPTEEGLHQMHITVNGSTILESPLQFYVNNASSSDLMAHGPGLIYGTSNELAAFTIYNKELALGELDIALEGPSKAEIRCLNNRDGTCTVTYLPTAAGDYSILVRHNDSHIPGSPFKARITATGPSAATGSGESDCKSQVRLGTLADFTLDISEEDISLLTASILNPSGLAVSCLLKRQPDSHIGISFIPKEVGEHLVSVMKDGQHVANSPIPLIITPLEIGDASRVKVFGPGLDKGRTCEMSDFVVDTREAGYGGLTLAVEGPSKVTIQTEELEDGTCGVSFQPTEPGAYTVSVKFADEHVPGSPFRSEVTESGHVRESITHYQGASTITSVGNTCGINLKIPGLDPQQMSAQVSSPSGALEEATLSTTGNDIYTVCFVPSETGVHAVDVLYRSQPIPGSPFQYTVGLIEEGGPEKVKAWGLGLQSAKASVPVDFSVWAREAGTGNLSVAVEGPSRAELVLEDRGDGSCGISYIAPEPGDYEVSVKFNNEHIQDSPYLVPVYVPADKALGQKDTGLQMTLPSGCGASSIWSSFLSDASKVASSGPGLRKAFVGGRNAFSVDCSKAGTNLLLVGMHGPTIPCEEVSIKHLGNNHYEVSYMVKEKGSYVLAVKWGEQHIPGSPFLVVVP
ncbi:filamin-B-like isoform X2 [Hypomesus transpacificus]|uniref:filamin-B-like isoform X2 n=1 Tax=Hypomesus transpacificus TaxID=137520 RepID=UPI001F07595D|nr:filamin-B-like isoform X2 [Hypomesus transpacificus]